DPGADGLAHCTQSFDVDARVLVPADLDLDRRPAGVHHAPGALGRHLRLDRSDDEFQPDAVRVRIAPSQKLVDGNPKDFALEIEQRPLDGGAGETVAECGTLHAPGDPLDIERIGTDDERGEYLADHGERAGLGFATPDGGDTGLAKAGAARVVGQ